jgi:hypothetical protein
MWSTRFHREPAQVQFACAVAPDKPLRDTAKQRGTQARLINTNTPSCRLHSQRQGTQLEEQCKGGVCEMLLLE